MAALDRSVSRWTIALRAAMRSWPAAWRSVSSRATRHWMPCSQRADEARELPSGTRVCRQVRAGTGLSVGSRLLGMTRRQDGWFDRKLAAVGCRLAIFPDGCCCQPSDSCLINRNRVAALSWLVPAPKTGMPMPGDSEFGRPSRPRTSLTRRCRAYWPKPATSRLT
jgi:hypothetical protein